MVSTPAHGRVRSAPSHGHALVEFLAVALAMVPLFLAVPVIGRLQHQAHAVEMASRQAAFDHALRSPLAQQGPPTDPGGAAVTGVVVAAPLAAPFDAGVQSALGLVPTALYRAQASLVPTLAPTPVPGMGGDWRIERQTTLLAGGWGGTDPAQVEDRVRGLVPGAAQAAAVLGPAMGVAAFTTELPGAPSSPAFGELERWRDLVPSDRLRP